MDRLATFLFTHQRFLLPEFYLILTFPDHHTPTPLFHIRLLPCRRGHDEAECVVYNRKVDFLLCRYLTVSAQPETFPVRNDSQQFFLSVFYYMFLADRALLHMSTLGIARKQCQEQTPADIFHDAHIHEAVVKLAVRHAFHAAAAVAAVSDSDEQDLSVRLAAVRIADPEIRPLLSYQYYSKNRETCKIKF